MAQHTLSVLVENSPGVLARVASLFSRRGYNIDSLACGYRDWETDRKGTRLNSSHEFVSRMPSSA